MLTRHLPLQNIKVDPRLAKTNDLGNLLNGLSFGLTDYGANVIQGATYNAFPALDLLKTSTSQIQDAEMDDYNRRVAAYQEALRQSLIRGQRR